MLLIALRAVVKKNRGATKLFKISQHSLGAFECGFI